MMKNIYWFYPQVISQVHVMVFNIYQFQYQVLFCENENQMDFKYRDLQNRILTKSGRLAPYKEKYKKMFSF